MADVVQLISGLVKDMSPEVRRKLAAMIQPARDPIAVVGMGARLPGGIVDPESFWRVVHDGIDAITEIPADRWDVDAYYSADRSVLGKMNTRWGGFIEDVDGFDAAFFGIAPREAVNMSPEQRLSLEVCWEALEHAGMVPDSLAGSNTGVFMAICSSDYPQKLFEDEIRIDAYTSTGAARNMVANRVSYLLDFRGPSVAIDTACSSSLVAVHLAVQALDRNECDVALAGGVQLILTPPLTISATRFGMLAPDGRCKAFDSRADGFVRAEGCGVVVLKRLSDALRDGDTVMGTVRGSCVNQDGRSAGLTAPNVISQQDAIKAALQRASLTAADVGYVETHGTGTPLGDPIEFDALRETYGAPRANGTTCALGALKTNIGHTEAAAGVAGMMKAILTMQHGEIPPNLHNRRLNPRIDLKGTPFVIPTKLTAWPKGAVPRRAAVSSFGFGGTNAHIVLEEAPAAAQPQRVAPPAHLLLLSAQTEGSLKGIAGRYLARLEEHPVDLVDVTHSAALRRTHHGARLAVTGADRTGLIEGLRAYVGGHARTGNQAGQVLPDSQNRVVFVFPGQGSQWAGMGRDLLASEPVFVAAIDACDPIFREFTGWSVREALANGEELTGIDRIQPTLTALYIGLAALWRSWGVEPDAVVGHSMGEIAAAHVAGALSLRDAARIICLRSKLMLRVAGKGAMALVELDMDQAKELIQGREDRVSIGVSNGPNSTVLSGDPEVIDAIVATLEAREKFCRRVNVDVASHSPQMDPLKGELLEALAPTAPARAQVPIYSTVRGEVIDGSGMDAPYWVDNLRQPVLFGRMTEALLAAGHGVFIEMSAHPLLANSIKSALAIADRRGAVLPSMRRNESGVLAMRESLGAVFTARRHHPWAKVFSSPYALASLPPYAFDRTRYWLEDAPERGGIAHRGMLGPMVQPADDPSERYWVTAASTDTFGWMADRRVDDQVLVPGAAILEMAWAAGQASLGADGVTVRDLLVERVLSVGDGPRTAQIGLRGSAITVHSRDPEGQEPWTLHARATLEAPATAPETVDLAKIEARCGETQEGEAFYGALERRGLRHGAATRGVTTCAIGAGEALAAARLPEGARDGVADFTVHPVLLDLGIQVLAGVIGSAAAVVRSIGRATRWAAPPLEVRIHARKTGPDEGAVQVLGPDGTVYAALEEVRMGPVGAAAGRAQSEWLWQRVWEPTVALAAAPPEPDQRWVVVGPDGADRQAMVARLTALGQRATTLDPDASDARALDDLELAGAIYLGRSDVAVEVELADLEAVGRRLADQIVPPPLWIVTRGGGTAWGVGLALGNGHPVTLVDVDAAHDAEALANAVVAELGAGSEEDQRHVTAQTRSVARLTRCPDLTDTRPIEAGDRPFRVLHDGTRWALEEVALPAPGPDEAPVEVTHALVLPGGDVAFHGTIDGKTVLGVADGPPASRVVVHASTVTPFEGDPVAALYGIGDALAVQYAVDLVGAPTQVMVVAPESPRGARVAEALTATGSTVVQSERAAVIVDPGSWPGPRDLRRLVPGGRYIVLGARGTPPREVLRDTPGFLGVADPSALRRTSPAAFREVLEGAVAALTPAEGAASSIHDLAEASTDTVLCFDRPAAALVRARRRGIEGTWLVLGADAPLGAALCQGLVEGGAERLLVDAPLANHDLGAEVIALDALPPLVGVVTARPVGPDEAHRIQAANVVLGVPLAAMLGQAEASEAGAAAWTMAWAAEARRGGARVQVVAWAPTDDEPAQPGVNGLSARDVEQTLWQVLASDVDELVAAPIDGAAWRAAHPSRAAWPFLAHLTDANQADLSLVGRLRAAALVDRRGLLEDHLRTVVSSVVGQTSDALAVDQPFKSLGVDSLMAMELRNRLEASAGVSLPVTMVWTYPTITALAGYIAEKVQVPIDEAPAEDPGAAAAETEAADALTDLDGLDVDEVAAMLAKKLSGLQR